MTRPSFARPLRSRLRIAVAAVCAAPLLAAAQATPMPPAPRPDDATMPHAGMPPHGGPMEMHHRRMERELDRLKRSLRLDARQTALWDVAESKMRPPPGMREQMTARHRQFAEMLDDPNFDPRRVAAEMDREHAQRDAAMKDVRDAWIAVYDSLNPVQRGQVREFLRGKLSHGPWAMERGGEHDGPHDGRPPGVDGDRKAPAQGG